MDNYTFFKNVNGSVYGVSERVLNSGHVPEDIPATEEEIVAFKQKVASVQQVPLLTEAEKIEVVKRLFESKTLSAEHIKKATGFDVHNLPDVPLEPVIKKKVELQRVIEPEPEPLSPAIQRRQARLQKKAEQKAAIEAANADEHLDFFDTLPEEELPYYENLLNQGLSLAQLYNIKVAKDAKIPRKEA